jgi:tetratricopeptide (TPR) repeat protein
MTRKLTALAGIGMTIGGAILVPAALSAQAGLGQPGGMNRVPDPNAKRVMVTTFKAAATTPADRNPLGVQAADALRSRMTSEFPFKQVYVLPKADINQYLEASGFTTTEALAAHDAKALAALMRADEYVVGSVTKTPAGFKIEANLVLARDNALQQPLGSFEGPKMDDAARQLSKEMKLARAQLDFEQKCVNSARDQKYDAAIAFAKQGIEAYPKATLARICQMKVMIEQKAKQEDLLAIAKEIVAIDPRSRPGLGQLAESYRQLNQQDSAVVTLTRLLATDPTNPRLQQTVVETLAAIANPAIARPVIDTAVAMNPGEPDLLRLRWLILFAVKDYKEAFKQGDELIRLDTSFADTTYYYKTAAGYQADSQFQKAAETAAKGLQKFPAHPTLTYMHIVSLKQAGQNQQSLEALDKALAAKIPVENGGFLRISLLTDLNRTEELLPAAKELIAAGDTSTTLRQMVLKIGDDKRKAAVTAKSAEGHDEALKIFVYADSVSKGVLKAQAGFLMGATYVSYANLKLSEAITNKTCAPAKQAKDYLAEAQINLPKGGQTFVDAMRQLMGQAVQLDTNADEVIKAYCK